jgi:hypothetical protein
MQRFGLMLVVGMLLPVVAAAQSTKMSGTTVCSPATAQHVLPVEGQPGHSYAVSQVKCTWTKPWQIGGVASKEGVGTGVDDIRENRSQASGTYVDTMANGDKAYYKYEFSATMKDGKPETISGHKWELLGGTGKMKAVKGKGTCNVTPQDDGAVVYECQGEYQ